VPSSPDATGPNGARGWLALSALLLAGSLLAQAAVPADTLDWQPARALREPWRAWTAAWVHLSALHLAANALGAALVGAFGWLARVPAAAAWGWFIAWPLTQLLLLGEPALLHYGGLSGVLHAGAVIAALHLALAARGARRAIGMGVLVGVAAKLATETPWAAPLLRHPEGWDIAVVPVAHLAGVVAGLFAGAFGAAWQKRALTIVRDD